MPHDDEKWLSSINFSGQVVQDAIAFKNTGAQPAYIVTPEQIHHYNETFKDFTVRNGHLFFGNREVIEEDDPTAQRDTIRSVYDSPEGLGKGMNSLTLLIQSMYLGVRRETVIDFLKLQPNYQMARGTIRIASRGLQVLAPFQTWAIDLIDVSNYNHIQANKNYNFIFSCLDLFSRYVWLVPLKFKTAGGVRDAFDTILTRNRHAWDNAAVQSRAPRCVFSDNGTEFAGEFGQYLTALGTSRVFNSSYVPVAPIENANRQVRELMRAEFIKYRSLDWLTHLQEIPASMNSSYSAELKGTPLEITQDYFERNDELINGLIERKRATSDAKFARHYGQDALQVGDHVRVRLASLISALRAREKNGTQKLNIVRYSPQVFVISAKYPPPEGRLGYASYIVQDLNGALIRKGVRPKRFRFNELIKVPTGLTAPNEMTQGKADKLNRVDETELIVPPEVVEAEHVKIETPPKPPVPVSQWKSLHWNEFLKGKQVTIDEIRYVVLDVDYNKSLKKYEVKLVRLEDVVEGKVVKGAVRVKRELASVLLESKIEPWYDGDLDIYAKAHLPVSGGRIRVLIGRRYIQMRPS